jgi:hypothetical protein
VPDFSLAPPPYLARARRAAPRGRSRSRSRRPAGAPRARTSGARPRRRRRSAHRPHTRRPVQVEGRRRVRVVAVAVEPGADELTRLDVEPGLLAELAAQRVERALGLLEEPARKIPGVSIRVVGTTHEQQTPLLVRHQRAGRRLRVGVRNEAAGRAGDPLVVVRELRRAARTEAPAVHPGHGGQNTRVRVPRRHRLPPGEARLRRRLTPLTARCSPAPYCEYCDLRPRTVSGARGTRSQG